MRWSGGLRELARTSARAACDSAAQTSRSRNPVPPRSLGPVQVAAPLDRLHRPLRSPASNRQGAASLLCPRSALWLGAAGGTGAKQLPTQKRGTDGSARRSGEEGREGCGSVERAERTNRDGFRAAGCLSNAIARASDGSRASSLRRRTRFVSEGTAERSEADSRSPVLHPSRPSSPLALAPVRTPRCPSARGRGSTRGCRACLRRC